MYTAKIADKCHIIIPVEIPRLLYLKPGDVVSFQAAGNGEVLIRKADKEEERLMGVVQF